MASRAARFSPIGMRPMPDLDESFVPFLTAIHRFTGDPPGGATVPRRLVGARVNGSWR
jgi:hypothetical protein